MTGINLTSAERVKICDLASEILKNQQKSKDYDGLVSRIALFVEGVKFGLQNKNNSNNETTTS